MQDKAYTLYASQKYFYINFQKKIVQYEDNKIKDKYPMHGDRNLF